jgi:hypothetical protein
MGGTEINYGVKYTATHDNSYQFYRDGETGALIPDNSEKLLRKEYTLNMYTGASHSFGKKFSAEVSLAAELYHAGERHSWMLYHYYIGGIILVSYPYHLKAEKCRRNERGLHA